MGMMFYNNNDEEVAESAAAAVKDEGSGAKVHTALGVGYQEL